MTRKLIIILTFLFCYTLILYRWYKIPIYDEQTQARTGVYGDAFSSRNVHSSAMWFKDIGYRKTIGLPVFGYTGNFNQQQVSEVYTHYPPLPDELAGMYARIINTKDPRTIAMVPIIISVIFFFFLLQALQKIVPDKKAAFISWFLMVISCYFICFADDLHQHLYTELLKWIFIWLLYRYYNEGQKNWMLVLLCIVYFLQSLLTYESIVYLAIIILGFSVIFTKRIITKINLLLFIMPVMGVALHLWQNYIYLGSWQAVTGDLTNAVLKRTAGTGNLSNELGRPVETKDFIRMWTYEIWFRIGRMYAVPAITFIVISVLALKKMYTSNRVQFKMGIVFLLASANWIFIMPQHALIHTFTIKHWGVFIAYVSGLGIIELKNVIVHDYKQKNYYRLIIYMLLLLYGVYGFVFNQVYYLYIKFGFGYPYFGTNAHLW